MIHSRFPLLIALSAVALAAAGRTPSIAAVAAASEDAQKLPLEEIVERHPELADPLPDRKTFGASREQGFAGGTFDPRIVDLLEDFVRSPPPDRPAAAPPAAAGR